MLSQQRRPDPTGLAARAIRGAPLSPALLRLGHVGVAQDVAKYGTCIHEELV